ncbi:MAG: GNAT family N-acetyltransferase [Firmicutes bacterium HGW-Firmicutes-7]|nr:MAG: GNAT family N-acetyltransferase [Firmicutes bacterium HGW-Firmicutes-7]
MNNITIRRPITQDIESMNLFFELVLRNTFERNGIGNLTNALDGEIEGKKKCLEQDIKSNGKERCFFIATIDNILVGTIESGPPNDIIIKNTSNEYIDLLEVGTVFVHPDYQKQGIGNMMLNHIFNDLANRGVKEFCLDSGYKSAQKIWKKKFKEPVYLLKDYWGEGTDHMIWRSSVSDFLK